MAWQSDTAHALATGTILLVELDSSAPLHRVESDPCDSFDHPFDLDQQGAATRAWNENGKQTYFSGSSRDATHNAQVLEETVPVQSCPWRGTPDNHDT